MKLTVTMPAGLTEYERLSFLRDKGVPVVGMTRLRFDPRYTFRTKQGRNGSQTIYWSRNL